MKWEMVIGLETHVELATESKIFCSCTTKFGGEPNTHCCPICTGQPGTLPSLNRKAVEYAVLAGLALNCKINRSQKWTESIMFIRPAEGLPDIAVRPAALPGRPRYTFQR